MIQNDKLIFLNKLGHALAEQFGKDCEVVIHKIDQTDIDHSIISIENGHVSSRKIGDGASQVVLEALKKDPSDLQDKINYLTQTKDGRILKSSTIYIHDSTEQLEAIFSINYDVSSIIAGENAIKNFLNTNDDIPNDQTNKITNNVNDLLDSLIEESVHLVGKPVSLMNKNDKVKAIQFLNDKGAFLIQKSGDKVSKFFNISKYTLYNYIG